MYNVAASVCDDIGSLISLRERSTECTVHDVSVSMHHTCIYMYKRNYCDVYYMRIIMSKMSRMCMVFPIRNFYSYRFGEKKKRD